MSPAQADSPDGASITVVITRRVRAGCEARYEDWLRRLTTEARPLPGYLGVDIHKPGPGSREYTCILRFDSLDSLRSFERSELRERYLAEVQPLVEADAVWQVLTGLEFWFSPPAGTVVPQPSRLRMSLLMVVVVFSLVLGIGSAINSLLAGWPYPARLLLTIVVEVFFMTYVLMPRLTRWLAAWIYPHPPVIR